MNADHFEEALDVEQHPSPFGGARFPNGLDTPPPPPKGHGFRRGPRPMSLVDPKTGEIFEDPEKTGVVPNSRKKATNHHPRAKSELESLGWFSWTVEALKSTYTGALYKEDCLGLFDLLAIKSGEVLGVQLTTKDSVGAHLRKYADPSKTVQGRSIAENLERFLAHGGRFQVWGYYQTGGTGSRWEHTVTTVTMEVIEGVISRRRK